MLIDRQDKGSETRTNVCRRFPMRVSDDLVHDKYSVLNRCQFAKSQMKALTDSKSLILLARPARLRSSRLRRAKTCPRHLAVASRRIHTRAEADGAPAGLEPSTAGLEGRSRPPVEACGRWLIVTTLRRSPCEDYFRLL